jgi:hypothetical protein
MIKKQINSKKIKNKKDFCHKMSFMSYSILKGFNIFIWENEAFGLF